MPTRCNRGFYCRSYCLLNMFGAPLCPSSGAQEYFTGGCCIILLSAWWWAQWCPKHVEQTIRSAIKTSVASSWHFISTYTIFICRVFRNSGGLKLPEPYGPVQAYKGMRSIVRINISKFGHTSGRTCRVIKYLSNENPNKICLTVVLN